MTRLERGAYTTADRELVRGLGGLQANALIVGGIIGASIFLVPALVAKEVGSPVLALLVWLVTGLVALCGALCVAELGAAMPRTGGTYVFLKEAYPNTPIPFLFCWSMFFAISTAAIAAVATSVALYAGYFLDRVITYGPAQQRILAVLVIMTFAVVNFLGVRTGGRTQAFLTGLKLLMIAGVAGSVLLLGDLELGRLWAVAPSNSSSFGTLMGSFAAAMVLTLFTYSGWHFSTHVAGEIKDPERNVPRSILMGMGIVITVYILLNVAFILALPFESLSSSILVAADAVEAAVGDAGSGIVAFTIVVSTLGGLNAQLLNYPRLIFSLARDRMFFKGVAAIREDSRAPGNAILLQGAVASVFALSGSYQQIITYVAFINHLFLTLIVASVILLRRRQPDLPRPYRAWGYPVTPMIFILISIVFLIGVLQSRFYESMVGVVIMMTGLPFYLYFRSRL